MDQQNETKQQPAFLLLAGKIIYYVLPLPVAFFSLSLMSMHMKYYDIGVNAAANNGFLLYFVLPALLMVLYGIAIITQYLAGRFLKSQGLGLFIGILLILVTGIGSFIVHDRWYADYPTEIPRNMMLFLQYYIQEI